MFLWIKVIFFNDRYQRPWTDVTVYINTNKKIDLKKCIGSEWNNKCISFTMMYICVFLYLFLKVVYSRKLNIIYYTSKEVNSL